MMSDIVFALLLLLQIVVRDAQSYRLGNVQRYSSQISFFLQCMGVRRGAGESLIPAQENCYACMKQQNAENVLRALGAKIYTFLKSNDNVSYPPFWLHHAKSKTRH